MLICIQFNLNELNNKNENIYLNIYVIFFIYMLQLVWLDLIFHFYISWIYKMTQNIEQSP